MKYILYPSVPFVFSSIPINVRDSLLKDCESTLAMNFVESYRKPASFCAYQLLRFVMLKDFATVNWRVFACENKNLTLLARAFHLHFYKHLHEGKALNDLIK